jgi:hypothetical protein
MSALTTKEIGSAVFLSIVGLFLVGTGLAVWGIGFFLTAWGYGAVVVFVVAGVPPMLLGCLAAWAVISVVRNARRRKIRYNSN